MSTDTLGRRSRFKRTPTGKHIVLGARDLAILQHLYRYRYLRQSHLLSFLLPHSPKRFIERLGDLFHETGLIGRPKIQWQHFDARCTPLIHEITQAGITYLANQSELPSRVTTLSRRVRRGRNPQFQHAMMIIDALVALELETRASDSQRFVPFDEILARAPETTRCAPNPLAVPVTIKPSSDFPMVRARLETHIIPDALYGTEYLIEGEKRYRFYALECERSSPRSRRTMGLSSGERKAAAYDALLKTKSYRTHWGIPNLAVQFVTTPK